MSSAKSWLSHSGVDRTAALLPFRAPEGVEKISPLEASRRYLEHLRHAWDAKMPGRAVRRAAGPGHRPGFLRRRGARTHRSKPPSKPATRTSRCSKSRKPRSTPGWNAMPIGASASASATDTGGGYRRRHHRFHAHRRHRKRRRTGAHRVAVGEHILLGGDNIDLALANVVAERLAQKGTRIDSLQMQALWNNCRAAKEKLLEPGSKAKEQAVTILGKGTGLVGGTIKATLLREDIDRVLGEGFLPAVPSTEMPVQQRRAGLQEIGLPYAADPAITRQLARFLRQQAATSEHGAVRRGPSGLACPTHVLFNGGVLNAALVRERITGALNAWLAEEGMDPVKPLAGEDLMHAVSRGAAYYGLARPAAACASAAASRAPTTSESKAPCRDSRLPRSAQSARRGPLRHGGRHRRAHPRPRIRPAWWARPAEFRFFTSAVRKDDQPGDLIEDFGDDLQELSPMEVSFQAAENAPR